MITGYERQRLASECRSMAYRHEFTAEAVADVLGLTLSGTTKYDHDAWYRLADLISPDDSDVRAAWVKSPVSRAQVSYFRDKMLMLAGRIEGDAESEEAMEPRTFEDLWLMRETSKEWFDGQLRYENVRKGADPEVGMVDSMSWHVVPFSDRVNVELHTHVIEEVRQDGHSMSLRTKSETLASYDTMEAFRASEWWGLTMEKFAGGDADASWLRSVELDGEEVGVEPTWVGYGPDVTLSVEVGRQYRDWLGNTRQDKGHGTLDVRVERMSGELWLCHDCHEVEGTVKEIEAAMMLVERLKRLGIEVGYTEIRVPIAEEGDADAD